MEIGKFTKLCIILYIEFHLLSSGSEGWEIEGTTQCRVTSIPLLRTKLVWQTPEQILASAVIRIYPGI